MDRFEPRRIGYEERADFYDIEYNVVCDQEFLRSLVTERVSSILEVPCGHGRNVRWLLETRRDVTFVDLEPRMIAQVQQTLIRSSNDPRRAVVRNMCSLALQKTFDLILVPREAFQGTLASDTEARAALSSFRRHLSSSGCICIDLARIEHLPCPRAAPMAYYDPSLPDGVVVTEWTREHPKRGLITRSRTQEHVPDGVQIRFMYVMGSDNSHCDFTFSLNLRRYSRDNFLKLAAASGLKVNTVLGTYEHDSYDETHSRMIVLLTHSDNQ